MSRTQLIDLIQTILFDTPMLRLHVTLVDNIRDIITGIVQDETTFQTARIKANHRFTEYLNTINEYANEIADQNDYTNLEQYFTGNNQLYQPLWKITKHGRIEYQNTLHRKSIINLASILKDQKTDKSIREWILPESTLSLNSNLISEFNILGISFLNHRMKNDIQSILDDEDNFDALSESKGEDEKVLGRKANNVLSIHTFNSKTKYLKQQHDNDLTQIDGKANKQLTLRKRNQSLKPSNDELNIDDDSTPPYGIEAYSSIAREEFQREIIDTIASLEIDLSNLPEEERDMFKFKHTLITIATYIGYKDNEWTKKSYAGSQKLVSDVTSQTRTRISDTEEELIIQLITIILSKIRKSLGKRLRQ